MIPFDSGSASRPPRLLVEPVGTDLHQVATSPDVPCARALADLRSSFHYTTCCNPQITKSLTNFSAMANQPHSTIVLDDNSVVRETLARAFEALGTPCRSAKTVAGFAGLLREGAPALVLVDLDLGQDSGIDALKLLSDSSFEGSVVILTGLDRTLAEAAVRFGSDVGLSMQEPLLKPVTLSSLRRSFACRSLKSPDTREVKGDTKLLSAEEISLDRISCRYQPIVELESSRCTRAEALARYRVDPAGSLSPPSFLPSLAEEELRELTRRVSQIALVDSAAIDLPMSLNIGPWDLETRGFASELLERARVAGCHPSKITLELTEKSAEELTLTGVENALELRLAGFKLSIDDFGMGHSSLLRLQRLPFTELKLDRAIVGEATSSRVALSSAIAAIELAGRLQMVVVAEGVETKDSACLMRDLGCQFAQGWFLADARTIDDWEAIEDGRLPAAWGNTSA